jgi:regulator of cell morphogenesis and NO signaling
MIQIESTLGTIVAQNPTLAGVFERLQLDYCCGGKQSLATACQARGLDAATVLTMLQAIAEMDPARPVANPAAMTLTELTDHIEQTHHVYVKRELPVLLEQARRLVTAHGERDPRHAVAAATVTALHDEMFMHMAKEEQILFPIVRQLDRGDAGENHCGTVANPIRVMELEHEHAGDAIHHLRRLTRGFTPEPDSCETHRAFLSGLSQFERDLHEHVHKENNILFPRAVEREACLTREHA